MTDDKARIRLAEAMGYRCVQGVDHYVEHIPIPGDVWISPSGDESVTLDFNPFTDANDCDAVIVFLNSLGHTVNIWRSGKDGYVLTVAALEIEDDGDDWKRGVCELALKVLDQQDTEK